MSQRQAAPTSPAGTLAPARPAPFWTTLAAAALLVGAGTWAYWNSFDGAFVLDDEKSIQHNPFVQPGTPYRDLLNTNRPIPRLTLAINFRHDVDKAIADKRPWPNPGSATWGYHLLNLMVHLAAALALMAVVRRTLRTDRLRGRFGRAALPLAFLVALIWAVHPLTTASVTYVVQRAESLMGLFLLLTLYLAIGALSAKAGRTALVWIVLATLACALGMGSKEVMVVAPLVVLAWDLVFSPDRFTDRLGRRLGLYIPLLCTFAVLAWGRSHTVGGGGAGIGAKGVLSPLAYAWTQFGVILHYLKLTFCPVNQCLDSLWPTPGFWAGILPMVVVLGLLAGTVVALWRRPALGFAGLWFFLILAPSSTFLPIRDVIFEHRMYLPLAAVVALVVCGGYRLGTLLLARAKAARGAFGPADVAAVGLLVLAAGSVLLAWHLAGSLTAAVGALALVLGYGVVRLGPLGLSGRSASLAAGGMSLALAAALVLGILTDRRNLVFGSEASVWRDVLRQYPDSPRANTNLGKALYVEGQAIRAQGGDGWLARMKKGLPYYDRAAELDPNYADPHYNLGVVYSEDGKIDKAIQEYERCLEIIPEHVQAMNNLGTCYAMKGLYGKAIETFDRALQRQPDFGLAAMNKSSSLRAQKQYDQAVQTIRDLMKAMGPRLESRPEYRARLEVDIADSLAMAGRAVEANEAYREALDLDDEFWVAWKTLGLRLANDKPGEAAEDLGKYLAQNPGDVKAQLALASCQGRLGQLDEAAAGYRAVAEAHPDNAEAWLGLGVTLRAAKDIAGASTALSTFLDLQPDNALGCNEMGKLLQLAGNLEAARDYFTKAIARDPNFSEAYNNLGVLWYRRGRADLAVPYYNSAVKRNPRNFVAANNLARLRATWPDAAIRNGKQAVLLADRVCKATGNANPEYLSTLAAACAEVGRFEDARRIAGRGATIAMQREDAALAKRLEAEMALYKTGRALRQRPRTTVRN